MRRPNFIEIELSKGLNGFPSLFQIQKPRVNSPNHDMNPIIWEILAYVVKNIDKTGVRTSEKNH